MANVSMLYLVAVLATTGAMITGTALVVVVVAVTKFQLFRPNTVVIDVPYHVEDARGQRPAVDT